MGNPLVIVLSAGMVVQLLKVVFYFLRTRKFSFRPFVKTGGMPSSHTAIVVSLCTVVGLAEGFESNIFYVSTVFSLIIMYDAAGVRQSVGRQAIILNKILGDLELTQKIQEKRLKELLGHTPLEVIMGALFGIAWALYWHY